MTKKQRIDFRERAEECARHATTALNERAREVWAKMEQYWRRRAAGIEAPLVPVQPPKWAPRVADLKLFEQELLIRVGALHRKTPSKS